MVCFQEMLREQRDVTLAPSERRNADGGLIRDEVTE